MAIRYNFSVGIHVKTDDTKRAVSTSDAQKWSKNRGYLYYEVSAKEGSQSVLIYEK